MTPRFPPEILDHILSLAAGSSPTWEETISYAEPDGNANETLLSAALTYVAWIESNARTRHRTVALWIRPCADRELFGRVIETCEGLESLVLGLVVPSLLALVDVRRKVAWHVLASPSLKELESLWLPFPEDFDWSDDTPAARLAFSLSSLALWFSTRQPEEKAFSILFTASRNTLHTLSLHCGPTDPPSTGLSATLPIVTPTVRHLILNVGERSLQDGLAGFDSLEHLEIYPSNSHPDAALSHAYLNATVTTLTNPNSLRHLTLGLVRQDLLYRLESVLDYPQLQGLQTLELLGRWVFGWDDEALVAACERRSIALVYADGTV